MAGLFIKDGPIVQVRSTGEPQEVLQDKDRSITWDGPLVIFSKRIICISIRNFSCSNARL